MSLRTTKWLYLPVEIQYRALDSKLLLACFAALRGYRTIVGEQIRLVRLLKYLPPGLYFDKSLTQAKKEEFCGIVDMGHKIVSLDEEGLSAYLPESYTQERFSADNLEMASAVFTWGLLEKKTIQKGYPVFSEKLHSTGNPRVDVWRSEFKRIHAAKAEELKKRYGRFILFPSNFGLPASPARTGQVYNFLFNRGDLNSDEAIAFFFERLAHNTRVFSLTCELIRDVSSRFPKHTIVVRPHPSEGDEYWTEKLKQSDGNIVIEHEGEITPYIAACDALVHHGCTTAVEAYCMGKPTIAFLPDFHQKFDQHPSLSLSASASDNEGIASLLEDIDQDRYEDPPNAVQTARDTFANFDTSNACESILNVIDRIDLESVALPSGIDLKAKMLEMINVLLLASFQSTLVMMRKVIPKYMVAHDTRYPKWAECSVQDVNNKIALFSVAAPEFRSVQAAQLSKNLFCIGQKA